MLDPQLLRAEAESVAERLTVKKYILDVDKLGSLEEQRKGLQSEVQDLQIEALFAVPPGIQVCRHPGCIF